MSPKLVEKAIEGAFILSAAALSAVVGYFTGKEASDSSEKKRRQKLDKEEADIARKMNKGK